MLPPGVLFSIDVECVATGVGHHDRAVAQIGLVDGSANQVLNLYVRPPTRVYSYLEPLTGLSEDLIQGQGVPLDQAVATLRGALPPSAVLVGQNIRKDIEWLGLTEGVDYAACIDLAGLTRVWNAQFGGFTYFGLDHTAATWLDAGLADGESHDAVADAAKSVRLYQYFCELEKDPTALAAAQRKLATAPRAPSFALRNPSFEGVCQGNRKTCTCGQPFFS